MLSTINTVAIGTLATISIIEHQEQIKSAAHNTVEFVKSSYHSTKNFISSSARSTVNSFKNMKQYIKRKFSPIDETYYHY